MHPSASMCVGGYGLEDWKGDHERGKGLILRGCWGEENKVKEYM